MSLPTTARAGVPPDAIQVELPGLGSWMGRVGWFEGTHPCPPWSPFIQADPQRCLTHPPGAGENGEVQIQAAAGTQNCPDTAGREQQGVSRLRCPGGEARAMARGEAPRRPVLLIAGLHSEASAGLPWDRTAQQALPPLLSIGAGGGRCG